MCNCKSRSYGYHLENCTEFDVFGIKKELQMVNVHMTQVNPCNAIVDKIINMSNVQNDSVISNEDCEKYERLLECGGFIPTTQTNDPGDQD